MKRPTLFNRKRDRASDGQLFRRYATLLVALVAIPLIGSALVQGYVNLQQTRQVLFELQQDKAKAAALSVERFVADVQRQLAETLPPPWENDARSPQDRLAIFRHLLRQVPAISEISYVDVNGREQAKASRLDLDEAGSGKDRTAEAWYRETAPGKAYFGPVYYQNGSQPYLTIAMRSSPTSGVLVAQVNLRFTWSVITQTRFQETGYAYIVDANGLLVAHPDLALVLRKTDMSSLPQVHEALHGTGDVAPVTLTALSPQGRRVASTHVSLDQPAWTVFVEEPLEEAFSAVIGTIVQTAVLLLIGLVLAIGASLILARRMSEKNEALDRLARELRDQNDALLDARQRTREMLEVILPPIIADELEQTRGVRPRFHDNVAVLFCDVAGFTDFCNHRDPTQVVSMLQQVVEAYEDLSIMYGLRKIKTIGDCFMATSGLLELSENPVLSCLRCGVEMITVIREIEPEWDVRVGIHVGPVVAGILGHKQYQYDLWGDTVNTASRMESNGVRGCVTMSQEAYEMVKDICECESLGLVSVKGKGELPIFRFVRWLDSVPHAVAAAG